MSKKLFFDFYGVGVEISSSWGEILFRLEKDFTYFKRDSLQNIALSLQVDEVEDLAQKSKEFTFNSSKVSFYEKDGKRFCFYFDKVCSEIDFKKGKALVSGKDINSVHEVSYLLVLSRVGKELDCKGFNRLHAGAFERDGILFLALFPSGGGKSTLLSSVMSDPSYSFFSDDSPLIGSERILPFPIRVGFNKEGVPTELEGKPNISLERFRFGEKKLFSLGTLQWRVGSNYKKVILLVGNRGEKASFKRSLGFKHLTHIIKEGIIGFGLPILYEYFWEYGARDFLRKVIIALGRIRVLLKLWFKAKKYKVTLESDLDKNKLMIESLAQKESN